MTRVFVGNLPVDTREQDLEKKFDKFGRIRSILIKYPQRPPAFAFIVRCIHEYPSTATSRGGNNRKHSFYVYRDASIGCV